MSFDRLKGLRNSPDPALSELMKTRREACKKAMKGLEELLYAPSEQLLREMEQTAPAMEALLELTLDFDREFEKDKQRVPGGLFGPGTLCRPAPHRPGGTAHGPGPPAVPALRGDNGGRVPGCEPGPGRHLPAISGRAGTSLWWGT
ncbi:MAG: hypothetical protein V8T45_09270 [Oscillospiraceae bacterium]